MRRPDGVGVLEQGMVKLSGEAAALQLDALALPVLVKETEAASRRAGEPHGAISLI